MNKTEVELTTEIEKPKSRRKLMRGGLGVAAAASGAGALLEMSTGTAHANGNETPTTFTSTVGATPAVTAIGRNGADGVVARSDTSNAITGTAMSAADAIVGTSSSGSGVTGQSSGGSGVTGQSTSGRGVFGKSTSGDGVSGQSTSGRGVFGSSQSGAGIAGVSGSGPGITGTSSTGPGVVATAGSGNGTALQVFGHILVQGNAVGQTTLRSERTAVTVRTSAATNNSIIVLTPLDRLVLPLWVTRDTGSFTIHISRAPERNVDIAFLVIN